MLGEFAVLKTRTTSAAIRRWGGVAGEPPVGDDVVAFGHNQLVLVA